MRRTSAACLHLILILTWTFTACAQEPTESPEAPTESPDPRALELHQLGYAELENEKPESAEQPYRDVIKLTPDDPLGYANLAIALLRQQKYEPAMRVLNLAPKAHQSKAGLLTIRAEILQWSGKLEEALDVLDQAAADAPDDPETLYAAFQLASNLQNDQAKAVSMRVLSRLAELRPENMVVMLQLSQRAIAEGDRTKATGAAKRISELLWQAQPIAEKALGMLMTALEQDDVTKARGPALRLENVLKVSAMFREGLRELKTGIQGIPYSRFLNQPPVTSFGKPLEISFSGSRLDERATAGRAVVTGHFDADPKPDMARIRAEGILEIRLAKAGWKAGQEYAAPKLDELQAIDINNDGHLDLLAFGESTGAAWIGAGDGTFQAAEKQLGLATAGASTSVAIDFDIEGDLDVVLAGRKSGSVDLYRSNLQGALERVGTRSMPSSLKLSRPRGLAASDLDRDGDLDLVIAHANGLTWLDNLRQGTFTDRSSEAGLEGSSSLANVDLTSVVSADLDNDGLPDLVGAGKGISAWHNRGGTFEAWKLDGLPAQIELSSLLAFDGDNDGRLDLATTGPGGLAVLTQSANGVFRSAKIEQAPNAAAVVAQADLDDDGDLDLVVGGASGLHWLENQGGNANQWLTVHLRGLAKGNSKNNIHGVGSVVEVRNGQAVQFREAHGDVVHLGLGSQEKAEVLRVVWTNGVPQNRLGVAGRQRIVEEQLLKGSCPFVYAWNGESFEFVTDLLWAAPLGLPLAPGVWKGSDPSEIVRLDGLVADQGRYHLRLTEELWEAAFFDHVRLWVVDHPTEVEVASNLRVTDAVMPEKVLASRDLRPMAAAWDGQGRDATDTVRRRDDVYADGYEESAYQGVARPWTFTFDLGETPRGPLRLHLDGWIFPADASLNLAVAQRDDLPFLAPRLEVETEGGWRTLIENMGFPAGKTKTMVIDTPTLPPGAHKLRIVTSLWLHWDRLAWTTRTADDEARVVARLLPESADLRFRGFSTLVRKAPNAPHSYDYHRARLESPWIPFPGHYTRFGDVRRLLEEPDDFSVILAPGDEIAVTFDARRLPPPKPGFARTFFLESHGWDKDADRNTYEGHHLEPLPFRAMSGYPFGDGESYPDSPEHRAYQREWLTREIP